MESVRFFFFLVWTPTRNGSVCTRYTPPLVMPWSLKVKTHTHTCINPWLNCTTEVRVWNSLTNSCPPPPLDKAPHLPFKSQELHLQLTRWACHQRDQSSTGSFLQWAGLTLSICPSAALGKLEAALQGTEHLHTFMAQSLLQSQNVASLQTC